MKDRNGKELTMQEASGKAVVRLQSIAVEFGIMWLHIIGILPFHHARRFFLPFSRDTNWERVNTPHGNKILSTRTYCYWRRFYYWRRYRT